MNLGDARHGGALRPSRTLSPLNHWRRDNTVDYQAVLDSLTHPTTCAAVFDNLPAAERFLARIKEEDLGLSVNISTSIDKASSRIPSIGSSRAEMPMPVANSAWQARTKTPEAGVITMTAAWSPTARWVRYLPGA